MFTEPTILTLGGVNYDLQYSNGTVRRLLKDHNINLLTMFADPKQIVGLIAGENLDLIVIEGVKRGRKGKMPDGQTEEAIVDAILELPLYGMPKVIKIVQDAIQSSLIDPEAPKPENPPVSPLIGASSGEPAA